MATAPASYAEVFETYYDFVKRLVAKRGIEAGDVEDVASELLIKFMNKEFLDKYDPNRVFETRRGPRTLPISSLLRSFVHQYSRNHLDRQRKRLTRCPQRCEAPVRTHESGSTWIEVYGPTADGGIGRALESVALKDALRAAEEYLEATHSETRLVEVFRISVKQALAGKKVTRPQIAKALGITEYMAGHRIQEMREALKRFGFDAELRPA